MNIADAIYLGITDGKYNPASEKTTAAGIIADLRPLFPSTTAAAKALGIPRTSWRRWAAGGRPTPRGFAALQAAQRRVRLPREREQWMRTGWIVLWAEVSFSGELEDFPRLISGWPQVSGVPADQQPQGMSGRIIDHWLAANDVAAVDALMSVVLNGLGEHAGHEVNAQFVTVHSVKWYRTRGEALQAMRMRRSTR